MHAVDVEFDDVAAVVVGGAERPEDREVEIDRAWADRATAGSGDHGMAGAVQ